MSLECADSDQLAADENRTKLTRIYREGVGIWHKRARKAGRGKRLGVRDSYIEERAAAAQREGELQDPEIESTTRGAPGRLKCLRIWRL
jgi:hypothetical protein